MAREDRKLVGFRRAEGKRIQKRGRRMSGDFPAMSLAKFKARHARYLRSNGHEDSVRHYERILERYEEYLRSDGGLTADEETTTEHFTLDHARGFSIFVANQPGRSGFAAEAKPRSKKTHREYCSALKTLTRFGEREGILHHDPLASRFPLPKARSIIPMSYTLDELNAMATAIEQPQRLDKARNRAIFMLLIDTGGRNSEICALRVQDVQLGLCRAKVLGKGDKERFLYFSQPTADAIATYLESEEAPHQGPLFVTRYDTPLRRGALYQLVVSWGEAAGVDHPTVHRFRHTFALTSAKINPGAVLALQDRLGHTTLDMSKRYMRQANAENGMTGPSPVEYFGLTVAKPRRQVRRPHRRQSGQGRR